MRKRHLGHCIERIFILEKKLQISVIFVTFQLDFEKLQSAKHCVFCYQLAPEHEIYLSLCEIDLWLRTEAWESTLSFPAIQQWASMFPGSILL